MDNHPPFTSNKNNRTMIPTWKSDHATNTDVILPPHLHQKHYQKPNKIRDASICFSSIEIYASSANNALLSSTQKKWSKRSNGYKYRQSICACQDNSGWEFTSVIKQKIFQGASEGIKYIMVFNILQLLIDKRLIINLTSKLHLHNQPSFHSSFLPNI